MCAMLVVFLSGSLCLLVGGSVSFFFGSPACVVICFFMLFCGWLTRPSLRAFFLPCLSFRCMFVFIAGVGVGLGFVLIRWRFLVLFCVIFCFFCCWVSCIFKGALVFCCIRYASCSGLFF